MWGTVKACFCEGRRKKPLVSFQRTGSWAVCEIQFTICCHNYWNLTCRNNELLLILLKNLSDMNFCLLAFEFGLSCNLQTWSLAWKQPSFKSLYVSCGKLALLWIYSFVLQNPKETVRLFLFWVKPCFCELKVTEA